MLTKRQLGVQEATALLREKNVPFTTRTGMSGFYYTAICFATRAIAKKAQKIIGSEGAIRLCKAYTITYAMGQETEVPKSFELHYFG